MVDRTLDFLQLVVALPETGVSFFVLLIMCMLVLTIVGMVIHPSDTAEQQMCVISLPTTSSAQSAKLVGKIPILTELLNYIVLY